MKLIDLLHPSGGKYRFTPGDVTDAVEHAPGIYLVGSGDPDATRVRVTVGRPHDGDPFYDCELAPEPIRRTRLTDNQPEN